MLTVGVEGTTGIGEHANILVPARAAGDGLGIPVPSSTGNMVNLLVEENVAATDSATGEPNLRTRLWNAVGSRTGAGTPQRQAKPDPDIDLALSIEVAEHVSDAEQHAFLSNVRSLFGAAPAGRTGGALVISWAHPGQGGHMHVNERSFAEVRQLLEERYGFEYDADLTQEARESATLWYVRQNVGVFWAV